MLEPRRVAARAAAARMAAMRGEPVGQTVGYQVRFDRKASPGTRIVVITEGILTRRFAADPFLDGISFVVLDEFHERSVHSDLALAFCRELAEVREDFRFLVMSATLESEAVSGYLGGAPVVRGEGRRFPVRIEHAPKPDNRSLHERAASGVRAALDADTEHGDVLVFLPGASDIRRLTETLESGGLGNRVDIVPLFGALPPDAQDRALAPGNRRRVVVATNIAETSLTIPGVTAVVDSGLVKLNRFDASVGLDRLETVPISMASAEQRAGRAGRTAPGTVVRLWTAYEHLGRKETDVPEIRRVDPATWLLHLMAFHPGDPRHVALLDAPEPALTANALRLLERLDAIDGERFVLTETGRRLATLPLHPRLGAILLRAVASRQTALGADVVALASERDICVFDDAHTRSDIPEAVDFEYRLTLLREYESQGGSRDAARRLGISPGRARFALQAKRALEREAAHLKTVSEAAPIDAAGLLLAGFPDRVCRLRDGSRREALMVGGRGVRLLAPLDAADTDLFVALTADAGRRGERSRSTVFLACPVRRAELERAHPAHLSRCTDTFFDAVEGRVAARSELRFEDLVIARHPSGDVDDEKGAALLAQAASEVWPDGFSMGKQTTSLLNRLAFANRQMPELGLPGIGKRDIRPLIETYGYGRRTLDDLKQLDWERILIDGIPFSARQAFDAAFPSRFETPAGRTVPLDYGPAVRGEAPGPVLACRLQALFGLTTPPRIAGGRVPITFHLLAPNGRPCQITRDLESFWRNTYPEIRKELKGRYPKHYWPDDPFRATPTTRVRPRS